ARPWGASRRRPRRRGWPAATARPSPRAPHGGRRASVGTSVLVDDGQGVGGAVLDRLLDGGPQLLGRALVEDGQVALLGHGEDGGRLALAHGVTLAEVAVDHDPPPGGPGGRRDHRRCPTGGGPDRAGNGRTRALALLPAAEARPARL